MGAWRTNDRRKGGVPDPVYVANDALVVNVHNESGVALVGDPAFEIARGSYPGIGQVNKFGRAPNGAQLTATDVWDRADAAATQQIWVAPLAARIHALVSTSDEDSDAGGVNPQGDGTWTIQLYGLTSWTTNEVSEVIVMDGTNPVNTANSYVIVHRIKSLTWGVTGPSVGTITATAAVDGSITAQVNIGQGQTQMAVYGIPSTMMAYMTQYYVSLHDSKTPAQSSFVDINLLVNQIPQAQLAGFVTKHTQGVSSFGTSYLPHKFNPYFAISGPAIIKMQATADVADLNTSAGFDMILESN